MVNNTTINLNDLCKGEGIISNQFEKFEKLEDTKKDNILTCAIKEFAIHGYKKGSTERITQSAGISKGILFHYFGSKENLFGYLIDYSIERVAKEFLDEINMKERDIFKRYIAIFDKKFEVIKEHLYIYDFYMKIFTDEKTMNNPKIKKELNDMIQKSYKIANENLDLTKFRWEVDIEKSVKIINWTLSSYSFEKLELLKKNTMTIDEKNIVDMRKEMISYLDILKKGMYKEEYL